jgi:hypothetical protein
VVLCGIAVAFYFVRGLRRKRDIWEPLWCGFLALALGLVGTVQGLVEALSRFASLGGVGCSPDLAYGAAKALVSGFFALIVMSGAIFCSLVLWRRRPLMVKRVIVKRRPPEGSDDLD